MKCSQSFFRMGFSLSLVLNLKLSSPNSRPLAKNHECDTAIGRSEFFDADRSGIVT